MQSSDKKNDGNRRAAAADDKSAKAGRDKPEWAQSLRQLYDSVVDEPLPANFKDLLDKLDKPK